MTLNGEEYLFDATQAKGSMYKELYRLPLVVGTTVLTHNKIILTEPLITILYFLHDGEGDLKLTISDRSVDYQALRGSVEERGRWEVSWDSTGVTGNVIVYGVIA